MRTLSLVISSTIDNLSTFKQHTVLYFIYANYFLQTGSSTIMKPATNSASSCLQNWLHCPHWASEEVSMTTPEEGVIAVYCHGCERIQRNANDHNIVISDMF